MSVAEMLSLDNKREELFRLAHPRSKGQHSWFSVARKGHIISVMRLGSYPLLRTAYATLHSNSQGPDCEDMSRTNRANPAITTPFANSKQQCTTSISRQVSPSSTGRRNFSKRLPKRPPSDVPRNVDMAVGILASCVPPPCHEIRQHHSERLLYVPGHRRTLDAVDELPDESHVALRRGLLVSLAEAEVQRPDVLAIRRYGVFCCLRVRRRHFCLFSGLCVWLLALRSAAGVATFVLGKGLAA